MELKELRRVIDLCYGKETRIRVIDTETKVNWGHGPAAHVAGTRIVVGKFVCVNHEGTLTNPQDAPSTPAALHSLVASGCTGGETPRVFVGHNISFDMLHILHELHPELRSDVLKALASGRIILWDTQDVEYVLTAHRAQFASLDDLATKHGVPNKKDTLKEYLDAGKNVDEIPPVELEEYLCQDILTTAGVAEAQCHALSPNVLATNKSTLQQLRLAAKRRAFTTIMMFNGMPFDAAAAETYSRKLFDEIAEIEKKWAALKNSWVIPPNPALEPIWDGALSSPKKLHMVLFGGETTEKEKVEVGKYKNGKPKYKTEAVPRTVIGFFWQGDLPAVKQGTDEHCLSIVADHFSTVPHLAPCTRFGVEAIGLVLEYRKLSKLHKTYIEPLIEMAGVSKTGKIHPSLNTTATGTGRLSASKPNSQNMPSDSPIKSFFGTPGWTCIEGDYKQLEMIALVLKSNDEQLKEDILNGVDIHYEVGKQVFGWTDPSQMTKETRRLVKSVDFGLVYGGGAKTLAAQSGASVEVVQEVIDSFFARYPKVKLYHKSMEGIAKSQLGGTVTGLIHENGALQRELIIRESLTGRRYSFFTYEDKYRKAQASFSPTELKNYMVQGLATADFVPFACDLLARSMEAAGWMDLMEDGEPKAMLCNTVHDSIVVWVRDEYAEEFASFMKAAMELAWPLMFQFFGSPVPSIPVVAEISVGPSWGETKEIKFAA